MNRPSLPDREEAVRIGRKVRAYGVHVFTASGIIFAFLAIAELFEAAPDPRWVFVWLAIAVLIDAVDGPLARLWDVKTRAPRIGGHTIDDLVDYLNFTFIPLLMVWRMGWVPPPAGLWVVVAMGASLFGFANIAAKQEADGFFLGFPSYWNIVAFYVGLWAEQYPPYGAYVSAAAIVILAGLTVAPVRFIYPNQAPSPWQGLVIGGAVGWLGLLLALLPSYPAVSPALMFVSLIYPVFYLGLSAVLDVQDRWAADRP